MSLQTKEFYQFANFRLDLSEKVLLRDGVPVPLTPKVFDTLKILIENAGHLLEKDELMRKIWQDRFVEESNLVSNIKVLRKALGDDVLKPQFIETVPRRGYRFIAEVKEFSAELTSTGDEPQTVFQKNDFAANASSKSQKFLIPLVALAVLSVVTIVVGSWFVRSNTGKPTAPVLSAPFSSEKLSTNGKVVHAVISPDGKTVVYTNGTGSDKESIWVRHLESSNNIEIIPPSDNFYAGLTISPNGNFLYFSRRPRSFEGQADIYRIPIFGGVPEKIINEAQGWMSISPDGARISFVRCYYRDDEYCSLWIADTEDGKNERKIAGRARPFRISANRISPDGKSIAFAVGQSENASNEFVLAQVDLDTGAERELTNEKFFNIKSLAWLPDESGLLITASRVPNNNFRIWQVSTASGKASPLTKDSESYSALNLDKDSNVLVSTQIKEDFHLTLLNAENPSNPRILSVAAKAHFAPNGRIYFSSPMSGNSEIWSVNEDGTGQRQLTNASSDESAPLPAPDNNSVFFSSNRTGAVHVWRMNADGSNQMQITNKDGGFPLFVTSDGERLYYLHGISRTLWRVSTRGGEEQLILDKRKSYFAISPDGSQVGFSEKQGEERMLTIVSLADGHTAKTFRLADAKLYLLSIVWLPDGKNLAYVTANSDYENNVLWLQSFSKEAPQKIADLGNDKVNSLEISPDGKTFAIIQGRWLHDAVLLKGLR